MSNLYDKYIELKNIDSNKYYLFRSGVFYIFLDKDAEKISNIIKLKLSSLNEDVVKCGFPKNSLDKYLDIFKNLDMDVEVIDDNESNKDINSNLEELIIYKQYLEMIYYTEMITEKYPKVEKYSLVSEIKRNTYQGMKLIIRGEREFVKSKKIEYLKELDVVLKMLKVLIRVSYKRKYINIKNYSAWSKKITNIGNLLGGWIVICRRV